MNASEYERRVLEELDSLGLSEDRKLILLNLVDEAFQNAESSASSEDSVSEVMNAAVDRLIYEVRSGQAAEDGTEFRGVGSLMANQKWLQALRAVLPWPFSDGQKADLFPASPSRGVILGEQGISNQMEQTDQIRQIEFAHSVIVQILTVAAAITTLTITFYGDIGKHSSSATRGMLIASWCCFVVSIACGCLTLLEMTGLVGREHVGKSIYSNTVRVPAMAEVGFFLVGIVLVVIGGALAIS